MAEVQTSLRSAGWVSLWMLGQLVVQVALQVALAKYFGASAEMDAFVAAMAIPTVVSSVVVGSFGFAFVPVFSQRWSEGDAPAAWSAATQVLFLLVCVMTLLSASVFWLAGPLTAFLYSGFSSGQTELARQSLEILAWLILANGLVSWTQAIHHVQKRFLVPAAAPVVGIAISVLWTVCFHERGITAAAQAVLAGSMVTLVLQSFGPLRYLRLNWRRDETVQRWLRLMVPLVFGAAYYRIDPLIDRYLASGLPAGSISHLGYASRVVTAVLMISTSGLSIVAFPSFAAHYARGHIAALRGEVAHALRCLVAIITPLVLGLAAYSGPLVRDVFQRGEFVATDTQAVAGLLVLYLGMIAGASLGEISSKVLYALADTRTPTLIGCAGFTVGLVLKIVLVGNVGVAGIVFATSTYFLLNALVMGLIVYHRVGPGILEGIGGTTLRAISAAALTVTAVWPLVQSGVPLASVMALLAGACLYLGCLWGFGDDVARRLVKYAVSSVMHR